MQDPVFWPEAKILTKELSSSMVRATVPNNFGELSSLTSVTLLQRDVHSDICCGLGLQGAMLDSN
jgi:hypothetical protein